MAFFSSIARYLGFGSTILSIGTITDGEYLKRSGTTIISGAGGGGGGITNSAGANVVMKSDGTNAVASTLTDTGGSISSTSNLIFSTDNTKDIGASGATRPRDLFLGRNALIAGTLGVTGHLTLEGVTSTGATGTGLLVFGTSPTFVTPLLGTPTSGVLTNATGLPISTGVSGLGTGVATFLATPTSANLASAVTNETGTGALVFANTPALVTPDIGVATGTSLVLTSNLTTGSGSGNAGTVVLTEGTAPAGAAANTVQIEAPVDVTTAYDLILPAASSTGFLLGTNASNVNTLSFVGSTGSGNVVRATSPTLVTPVLGTPSSGTLTSCTGLPEGGLSLTDITTNNSSTSNHGFLKKLSNVSTEFMNGQGNWATPAGAGTVTASGGSLTANAVVLGAGTTDTKVVAGVITDGTSKLTLGVAGTSVGSVDFKNATSGTVTIAPVTGALGTVTLSLPAATDTLVGKATTDTLTNKTLTSPTLTTPVLGTPSSGTLTSCTGLPISTGVSGLGTGVATFLATPSSANLAAAVTDETGSGLLVFATSPSLTTPVLGTPTSGNLSNCTADGTNAVGFLQIPQNSKSAAYTTVLADGGKHIYHPGADTTARTWTIDSNANVAYPIGTSITFINDTSGGVITIAITSDTMILAGAGTTGSRTLAANGVATAIKMTSTRWIINGTGLT